MLNLLRKPLTWIVLLECAVACGLALVAWHMVASAAAQNGAGPAALPPLVLGPDSPTPQSPALPPAPSPTARAPLPGLNLDVGFWRVRLADLNSEEAAFEALEWRIVHSCQNAASRYIESVVLPAVVQAERQGR